MSGAPSRLAPDRGHRRVRHPGRRRQGQGAAGRGRAGHRLRCRRARLPDARAHRRGRGRGVPRSEEPPVHAGRRLPSCGGDRREDVRDSGYDVRAPPRSSSPTAASTRCTTRSRRCSTPVTRCCCPRRTGPPTPSRSRWPAACPVVLATDETHRLPGHRRPARSRAHRAHQGAAVRVAVEPDRRRVPAGRGRGDRPLGRRATASGSSPTRSTSTSPTATTSSRRCRRSCPRSPTVRRRSTAWPRPTP